MGLVRLGLRKFLSLHAGWLAGWLAAYMSAVLCTGFGLVVCIALFCHEVYNYQSERLCNTCNLGEYV